MTSLTTSGRNLSQKVSQMPPPMSSDEIYRERFQRGSLKLTYLSGTTGLTYLPDMTSLATSSRLQMLPKTSSAFIEVKKKKTAKMLLWQQHTNL